MEHYLVSKNSDSIFLIDWVNEVMLGIPLAVFTLWIIMASVSKVLRETVFMKGLDSLNSFYICQEALVFFFGGKLLGVVLALLAISVVRTLLLVFQVLG
jgi:hypothetical protein